MSEEGFLITAFVGGFCAPEGAAFVGGGAVRPQTGFSFLITKGLVTLTVLVDDAGAVPVELALVDFNFGTADLTLGAREIVAADFFAGTVGRVRLVQLALAAPLFGADESNLEGFFRVSSSFFGAGAEMGTRLGPPVVDGCSATGPDFVSDATCNRRGATVIAVVMVAATGTDVALG